MKIAATISRYLLGLMFTVFGLNGFFHFIPQPPPTGMALEWMTVMGQSHYMYVVFAFQLVAGVLLLVGRFVPLALTILAAVLVNIFTFHLTMAPSTIGPGVLAAILWVLVFLRYRANFQGLFDSGSGSAIA